MPYNIMEEEEFEKIYSEVKEKFDASKAD